MENAIYRNLSESDAARVEAEVCYLENILNSLEIIGEASRRFESALAQIVAAKPDAAKLEAARALGDDKAEYRMLKVFTEPYTTAANAFCQMRHIVWAPLDAAEAVSSALEATRDALKGRKDTDSRDCAGYYLARLASALEERLGAIETDAEVEVTARDRRFTIRVRSYEEQRRKVEALAEEFGLQVDMGKFDKSYSPSKRIDEILSA